VTFVELKGVKKSYGNFQAAKDISFSVEKGKIVGLIGPSGSGKTTLLRMIAGLDEPDEGEIRIDGSLANGTPPAERGIGFVFQNYALFRYMTAFQNIAFGLEVQKLPKAQIKERVEGLIALIGLEGMQSRYPGQLSGGQKQRVAFARALAPSPRVLLLDEPFAAIDAKVRRELRGWLRETIAKVGITSVFVTHDQEEAVEVADSLVLISSGRIEQSGPPAEIYQSPQTPFAASFVGDAAKIQNYSACRGFSEEAGWRYALVRPEFVRLERPGKELYPNASEEGVVADVLFRGNAYEARVTLHGESVLAQWPLDEAPIQPGDKISVLISRMFLVGESQVRKAENALLKGALTFSI
jgi:sulfate transport system ATP-binding protein